MLDENTESEIFEYVAKHLITQGVKAMSAERDSICKYRGPKGTSCAVGCLILDKEYTEYIEEGSWSNHASSGTVPKIHVNLLDKLQNVHDDYAPEEWPSALYDVAVEFKLDISDETLRLLGINV